MRAKDDITYQDYKDGVLNAFAVLGYENNTSNKENIVNYMTDEDNDLLTSNSTSLALWIISIGEYEIRNNILEDRVLEQLSYHIPKFEEGHYTNDLSNEEYEQIKKDVEYIKSKVTLNKFTSYKPD